LRQHQTFPFSYDEPAQRLLNAMEPDSYIRPHRHLTDPKREGFVGACGRMALLVFDDGGAMEWAICFGLHEDGCTGSSYPLSPTSRLQVKAGTTTGEKTKRRGG
jgi:cupin fold WbuC family metalloprotein